MNIDQTTSVLYITSVFLFIAILEFIFGLYKNKNRSTQDWIIDLISLTQLAVLLKPAAIFISLSASIYFLPSYKNALSDLPFWLGFLIVFIPDDFSHYWFHRLGHQLSWMWPMHRTHHTPRQYQVTISFRENWSWLFFMPGFWWMGLMIHLGLEEAVILSATVIGLHNVILHNGFLWDVKLYKAPKLGVAMRLLERVFNTPSLHRGHHGLGENSVPFGNYGQTLFIWDQLFGTAKFLGENVPEAYGTIAKDESKWYQQIWWPLFSLPKSKYTVEQLDYIERNKQP